MHQKTRAFLDKFATKTSVNRRHIEREAADLLRVLNATIADAFELVAEHDDAWAFEEDASVRSSVSEYAAKLKGLETEAQNLRTRVRKVVGVLRQLEELDARVGGPLRNST